MEYGTINSKILDMGTILSVLYVIGIIYCFRAYGWRNWRPWVFIFVGSAVINPFLDDEEPTLSKAASNKASSEILSEISTSSSYVWENIDYQESMYFNLAFRENGTFDLTTYIMQGGLDNLSPMMTLSGNWEMSADGRYAKGRVSMTDTDISWRFKEDFTSLVNNQGMEFTRVRAD